LSAHSTTTAKRWGLIPKAALTRIPMKRAILVRASGVDSLAVAIGNSHGAYKFKGEQHLDWKD